jgi:hypothetical protein
LHACTPWNIWHASMPWKLWHAWDLWLQIYRSRSIDPDL